MLTTGVPPQLRDDTLDKLKRLQDILAPTTGEDSRGVTNEHAIPPRVQIHPQMHALAPPPRMPTMPSMDATEFVVLPPMWQWFQADTREPPTKMTKQQPRRSRRIAEKTEKIRANVGILQRPSEEVPRRSKRLEEVRDRRKDVAGGEKINGVRTTSKHPRRQGRVEVQTLKQELVLACNQTYVEVTERQVLPRQLSQRKFPTEFLNAVLNKDTGELMKMRHLMKNPKYSELWRKSYTKELGQLVQGIPGTKGSDTIVFIKYDDIPLDR
jgi:hypothetical protein